jgi:hypothetical protein
MVSFLLPSRKRFKYLKNNIEKLLLTASDRSNFEVNFVFDSDDVETLEEFNNWHKDFNHTVLITPRLGYHYLHEYYNMSALKSSGKWLWVWNDDCEMVSHDWDKILLEEYKSTAAFVVNPLNLSNENYIRVGKTMFPIVPRFFYDVTGCVSRNQHVDNYIEDVSNALGGIMFLEERINHLHPEERINDEVTGQKRYHSNQDFCSAELFNSDMNKIKEYNILSKFTNP